MGPLSSNEMDQLYQKGSINDETKVAFETLDKFVRIQKILKLIEDAE